MAGGPLIVLTVAAATLLLAGCSSPESTRQRSGGAGGDVGNRARVVQMHGGSRPYWGTPERLAKGVGMRDLGPAQQSARAEQGAPALRP